MLFVVSVIFDSKWHHGWLDSLCKVISRLSSIGVSFLFDVLIKKLLELNGSSAIIDKIGSTSTDDTIAC